MNLIDFATGKRAIKNKIKLFLHGDGGIGCDESDREAEEEEEEEFT